MAHSFARIAKRRVGQFVHGLLLFAPLAFLVRRDGPLPQPLERLDAFASGDERLFGGLELDPAILGVGLGPHQLATQGTNPIPMPDHVGDRSAGGVERRGARRTGVEGRLRVGERCAARSEITRASATASCAASSSRRRRSSAGCGRKMKAAMRRLVSAARAKCHCTD